MTPLEPPAALYIPDGTAPAAALARVTHLGVGAHPDDLEFMAFHGIIACYNSDQEWFGGITCTDGAGSARTGAYAHVTDAEMCALRRAEQNRAADLGRYGAMVQLGYPSASVQDPENPALSNDLSAFLRATRPRVVYTHNLADKHDTHVAVALATLAAVRALPPDERPGSVYGCEVWRDLDWLPDADKVRHDVSGFGALAESLNGAFASQIAGGKRYDLGVTGRRRANATFADPRAADRATEISFAMDLTPLAHDETWDITAYIDGFVERFRADVRRRLSSALHPQP